jgi:quercetin dioxygenase-like cupin family protein
MVFAACCSGFAGRAALAQRIITEEAPRDSAPACALVDSAVVDSAVQAALAAARGPRSIQPRLIVVDPPATAAYGSLDAMEWQVLDLGGAGRLQIAPMHGGATTRVRQLLLRLPANAVLPTHWHGAAETLLVLRGTVTVREETDRLVRLTTGGFQIQPSGASHSLAAGAGGVLLLITSDGTWDIHLPAAQSGTPAGDSASAASGPREAGEAAAGPVAIPARPGYAAEPGGIPAAMPARAASPDAGPRRRPEARTLATGR